jgi:hypothetical protein
MEQPFLIVFLAWLSNNTLQLIQLLGAVEPVLALLVVGYMVHALVKRGPK